MTNVDNNRDTKNTINNDTNNHIAHYLHKWAQQRAVSRLSCLTDDVSHHIGSSSLSLSSPGHVAHVWFSLIFTYLPFYVNLSFTVFFHSSVLMHPDLHTDLGNLNSVKYNLRHSAKGSNDAYDVTHSLTGYEPNDTVSNDTVSNELIDSRGPFAYVTPSSDQDLDDTTLGKLLTEAHREYADYRSLEGVFVSQSSLFVVFVRTGILWEKEMSINQLVLGARETRTVLTASFLKTPKLRKWSIEQGNLWEKIAQMQRLGFYLKNWDKWLSQNITRRMSFHFHPIHVHVSSSLSVVLFSLTFCFLLYFIFLLFLFLSMTHNDSMNVNTLCNFANGTFVTLDNCTPDTGYEPNVMEFTGTTELNNAASSDINFQDSLDYTALSSDFYIDDDELGKLLAEVHRDGVDYRLAEGVNVSPSSVSVMVDRTGNLWKRGLLRSVKAQMHRLGPCLWTETDDYRSILREISHHELQASRARRWTLNSTRKLCRQQKDFREVHQLSLTEMEELRKFQSSPFDTLARRKFIEDQNTIMELSGRLQELQNEVNCMNDSKDFQDAESVRSGNSHVTSQPKLLLEHPIPEGLLRPSFVSPRCTEGLPAIWDTPGFFGKRFGRSICIFISSLSSRIASMEFINRGATSYVYSGEKCLLGCTNISGSLEPTILSKTMPTCSLLVFEMTVFRNSIQSGAEFYYQW